MSDTANIIGIIGSYRKSGTIDRIVTELLDAASARGASTRKVYLTDLSMQFCTNCRECGRQPGEARGRCVLEDDVDRFLDELEQADGIVLGSPVNYGGVTAISRQFLERCSGYLYYPLGAKRGPVMRKSGSARPVVLVSSSAAPKLFARLFFDAIKTLRQLAKMLGGREIGLLQVGWATGSGDPVTESLLKRARMLGVELAMAKREQQSA